MKDIKTKPQEDLRSSPRTAKTMPKQAIKMLTEQAKEKAVVQGREQLAPKEQDGESSPNTRASEQMVTGVGMAVTTGGHIGYTGGRRLAQKTAERIKQRRQGEELIHDSTSAAEVPAPEPSRPAGTTNSTGLGREPASTTPAEPRREAVTKKALSPKEQPHPANRIKTKETTVSPPHQKPTTVGREAPRLIKTAPTTPAPGITPPVAPAVRGRQAAALRPAVLKLAREKAATSAKAGQKALEALKRVLASIRAALQSLVTAIATALSVAAALVLLISLVAFIAGSAYGIFFAAEPTGDGISVQEAIAQLNDEYRDELESIASAVQHDRQEIQSNDGAYAIAWQNVLTVFSSRVSGAADGAPVAVLDAERLEQLREITWDMNEIDYSTHTETHEIRLPPNENESEDDDEAEPTPTPDGEATPDEPRTTTITETVLVIKLTHKTPEEMAIAYAYTPRQQQYLELLADPQNDALWLELLGSYTASGGGILTPGGDWAGDGTLQWPLPVAGSITSPFGYRTDPISGETSYHSGTDISAANGTPIMAAAAGTVVIANGIDSWGGSYGYHVKLDHGSGLQTLYAHCSSICVTVGQQVQAGEVIGYVGSTGRSTGNHLHFEVLLNGARADAMAFFQG